MDFKEYVYSMPKENRVKLLENLSQYGNPNDVLKELLEAPLIVNTKKDEIHVSKNFLLWRKKKTFWQNHGVYLYELSKYKYCYYSEGRSGGSAIGLVEHDKSSFKLWSIDKEDSERLYLTLRRVIRGFEETESTYGSKNPEGDLLPSNYSNFRYQIVDGRLESIKPKAFSEKKNIGVVVPNIKDIIWCTQFYSPDSDADDTYAVELYVMGSKQTSWIFCSSEHNCFETVLALKDHIPHLLYGPSDEYKKLFKKNPAALMEIAKSQVKK